MQQTSATARAPKAPPKGAPPAISIRGLGHRFGDKEAIAAPLDLEVSGGGGVIGLLGPNGSGKSTLMRILIGLVPIQTGEVQVDGARLEGDGLSVRRRVTYAPGELHLYGELSGAQHLDTLLRGRDGAARARARATATDLGLPLAKRVRDYSHGMKRQLVFAAAMAPDVRVRILDEISEGLDPSKRSEILQRIEADAARGTVILLSSHHLGEVDRACHRLVFVDQGRIIADETAAEVTERAARIVRIGYADPSDAARLAPAGGALPAGVESISADAKGVVRVILAERDPRPFLDALMSRADLPAPTSVEYGRISLSELYTTLYGVEGT